MGAIRRWLLMLVLGFSGGVIFLLPFLREFLYKPLSEALELNNTEFGMLMSVFGLASLLAYVPGGWLADRYSPRKLITSSLVIMGTLGLYFSTFPGYRASLLIHAGWGVAITLMFWASMIRVTRGWAPPDQQGRAFGILETTRGVAEMAVNSSLLAIFVWLGSTDHAVSTVIVVLSTLTIALGVVSWIVIEDTVADRRSAERISLADVRHVLKMPVVWLIAVVILAAYSAYWTSFYFTPYATDVFLMSAGMAGAVSIARMWLKPGAAVLAGFAADRFGIARTTVVLFMVLILSFGLFAATPADPAIVWLMLVNIAVAAIAIFALRGIYFALLEEGGVPVAVTGTAGGVVSFVGYTPDIYMPYIGGVLLDGYPGVEGYRYFYLIAVGFCTLGFAASLLIYRRTRKRHD